MRQQILLVQKEFPVYPHPKEGCHTISQTSLGQIRFVFKKMDEMGVSRLFKNTKISPDQERLCLAN